MILARKNKFLLTGLVTVCGGALLIVIFLRNNELQKSENVSLDQKSVISKLDARTEYSERLTKVSEKTPRIIWNEKTSTKNSFKAPQQSRREIEPARGGSEKRQLLAIQDRGIASKEYQEILPELRTQNDILLQNHRKTRQNNFPEHDTRRVEKIAAASLYKMQLDPLPSKKDMKSGTIPQNNESIESLRHLIALDTNSETRERNQLLLAGTLIGNDDWQGGQRIYEDLMGESSDPLVLEAVKRNIQVVNIKLKIDETVNPKKKQFLELALAEIHLSFEQISAAKRIYKRLSASAVTDEIRDLADTKLISLNSKIMYSP